jgi:hypothetical protein
MSRVLDRRAPWVVHVTECDRCRLAVGLGAARSDLSQLCMTGRPLAALALRRLARQEKAK